MRFWRGSFTIALSIGAISAVLFILVLTQSAAPPQAIGGLPRIAGKPDFSGIWPADNTCELGYPDTRGSAHGCAAGLYSRYGCSRCPCPRTWNNRLGSRRSRRRRRRRDSLFAVGRAEKERESRALDGS